MADPVPGVAPPSIPTETPPGPFLDPTTGAAIVAGSAPSIQIVTQAFSVQIRELNGVAPGTATDKTSGSLRFKLADDANVDLQNPIRIPTSQTAYSYEKMLQVHVSVGTSGQISNLRAWSDGAGFTGGLKLWAQMLAGYVAPVIPSTANDPPLHGATPFVDLFSFTVGNPANLGTINPGPYDASGVPKAIGDVLCLVAEVEIGATSGVRQGETITFGWDET